MQNNSSEREACSACNNQTSKPLTAATFSVNFMVISKINPKAMLLATVIGFSPLQ